MVPDLKLRVHNYLEESRRVKVSKSRSGIELLI
jgi:hypothetical protein